MLLLDTNICIAIINDSDSAISARFLNSAPGTIVLCAVVRAELLFGARNSRRVDPNLRLIGAFLDKFPSLPFDDAAAHWYATVRAELHRSGGLIGGNDLMIAAIALAADVTVVTRNEREFSRVPGLRREVW